jgi:hypothetical protein
MTNFPAFYSPPRHPVLLYAAAGVLIIVAALCGYTLGSWWVF